MFHTTFCKPQRSIPQQVLFVHFLHLLLSMIFVTYETATMSATHYLHMDLDVVSNSVTEVSTMKESSAGNITQQQQSKAERRQANAKRELEARQQKEHRRQTHFRQNLQAQQRKQYARQAHVQRDHELQKQKHNNPARRMVIRLHDENIDEQVMQHGLADTLHDFTRKETLKLKRRLQKAEKRRWSGEDDTLTNDQKLDMVADQLARAFS